jgi:hypothetical protein
MAKADIEQDLTALAIERNIVLAMDYHNADTTNEQFQISNGTSHAERRIHIDTFLAEYVAK